MEKKCTKCGEVKPKGAFYKDDSKKDGLGSQCKECARARARKYRAENAGKVRAKARKRRAENLEKERVRLRKWQAENPEKVRALSRKWKAENPERVREYNRKSVEELPPSYIKKSLTASGLPPVVIEENPELIELKRLQIQLKRKINQKKKEL